MVKKEKQISMEISLDLLHLLKMYCARYNLSQRKAVTKALEDMLTLDYDERVKKFGTKSLPD